MKRFEVQGIELEVKQATAFTFIADPAQLPKWTDAFASVSDGRAVMRTPGGEIVIDLDVDASAERGTIDWRMKFPDGSLATAFSRVVGIDSTHCVFSFILTPPPVPLEQLEGALESQAHTLSRELQRLKRLLEHKS
jgi:hypothetical protein